MPEIVLVLLIYPKKAIGAVIQVSRGMIEDVVVLSGKLVRNGLFKIPGIKQCDLIVLYRFQV